MPISPIQLYNIQITKSDYSVQSYAVENSVNQLAALQALIAAGEVVTDVIGITITEFNSNLVT